MSVTFFEPWTCESLLFSEIIPCHPLIENNQSLQLGIEHKLYLAFVPQNTILLYHTFKTEAFRKVLGM